MVKFFNIALVCVSLSGLTACSTTQSLSTEMQVLNNNYKTFANTTDHKEAMQALNHMQAATLASQKKRPVTLSKDSSTLAEFTAYQDLYTQLNTEIIKAKALTQAGQLEAAKQQLKNIDAIKKVGHQRYKP